MAERHYGADAKYCLFTGLLQTLYQIRKIRGFVAKLALRLERGEFYSGTIREILWRYYGVQVGEYSYRECMSPGKWPSGITVGRYVLVGADVKVLLRNHPMERLSMRPFFYNKSLSYVVSDTITSSTLNIGRDVWIGDSTIFISKCNNVGIGAVIAAGSIVTKDVPAFAVVDGNPTRLIRYWFEENVRNAIIKSRWWERSVSECIKFMPSMIKPLGDNALLHPLVRTIINFDNDSKD